MYKTTSGKFAGSMGSPHAVVFIPALRISWLLVRISYSPRGEQDDKAINKSFFLCLKEEWRNVFI